MNAQQRIHDKQNRTLYKKVGKKYVPVNDPFAYDGLAEGWWLVKVEPNCTSIRACVFPAKAELQAAIRDKSDQILDVIRKCSEAAPKNGVPLSEQAKKDWEWFMSRNGKEFSTLYYPSWQSNADKIVEILVNDRSSQ